MWPANLESRLSPLDLSWTSTWSCWSTMLTVSSQVLLANRSTGAETRLSSLQIGSGFWGCFCPFLFQLSCSLLWFAVEKTKTSLRGFRIPHKRHRCSPSGGNMWFQLTVSMARCKWFQRKLWIYLWRGKMKKNWKQAFDETFAVWTSTEIECAVVARNRTPLACGDPSHRLRCLNRRLTNSAQTILFLEAGISFADPFQILSLVQTPLTDHLNLFSG